MVIKSDPRRLCNIKWGAWGGGGTKCFMASHCRISIHTSSIPEFKKPKKSARRIRQSVGFIALKHTWTILKSCSLHTESVSQGQTVTTELGAVGFAPELSAVWRYWVAFQVLTAGSHVGGLQLVGVSGADWISKSTTLLRHTARGKTTWGYHQTNSLKHKCHFFVFILVISG